MRGHFILLLLLLGGATAAQAQLSKSTPLYTATSSPLYKDSLDYHAGPAFVMPYAEWSIKDNPPAGKGVIYGLCLQRLGFSSGGIPQFVRVINLDGHTVFRLNVKPVMKSRQDNLFCYALPPGRYALHSYEYSSSKWYGSQLFIEPLRKPVNELAVAQTRYIFTVVPGQVQYVGTWDFSQQMAPRFLDQKPRLDSVLTARYPRVSTAAATRAIPQ